jgi:hypothetical protein
MSKIMRRILVRMDVPILAVDIEASLLEDFQQQLLVIGSRSCEQSLI